MNISFVCICSLLLFLCESVRPIESSQCGYESCPSGKPGVINVHIAPHTHDDVGWLKTIDQYYYGSSTFNQRAGVQYIIDSVVKELQKDPKRRFIYVEMAFFWQWWQEQTNDTKIIVKQLVEEGRLEFINGGWCMNDEATTHYNDIIDQMTFGLRFLNDTFGHCARPRVAWQIDPFGHSREQASLFALMEFDSLFFARLDWLDKDNRLGKKQMEMLWKASNSLGNRGSIFTGALYDHYGPPPNFCFDILCGDEPIIDNIRSPEYNVPEKIGGLINYAKKQASRYATNHIMFTMGSDFNYMNANMWFKNMDKMIKYANKMDSGINMFYSTPSCYTKALNDAAIQWPVKSDDFFPYSSDPHAYWTGYFTSRASLKGMVRKSNTFLQVCKQLHTLSGQNGKEQELIDRLRRAMAEAQHHDAVAGTEKQHVAYDYALRLNQGIDACQKDIATSFNLLLPVGNQPLPEQKFCPLLNISQCDVTEKNSRFVVTVYNPRSQQVTSFVRLPVTNGVYSVTDPDGNGIASQLVPVANFTLTMKNRQSEATHELVFQVTHLPALGHQSFYVEKMAWRAKLSTKNKSAVDSISRKQHTTVRKIKSGQKIAVSNKFISVAFDTDGFMESITVDGQLMAIQQNLLWYYGMKGRNEEFADRASGAYIFRPNGTDAQPLSQRASLLIHEGGLVKEVHQVFNDWAAQVVRIYKDQRHVEIEWTVGPIPVSDGIGKEIINRIVTKQSTASEFYTDSNGRQTIQRKRDYRTTWNFTITEPVSGNYYPVNSHIYTTSNDCSQLIALVTDRSQGGTSLHDGEIELMVHRRLLYDDSFGVGEALNETCDGEGLTVRGKHFLVVQPNLKQHPMSIIRPLTQQLFMDTVLVFSPTDLSYSDWKTNFQTQKSGLSRPLPDNILLLTLEPWKESTHLLRLENVYDINENNTPEQNTTVRLDDLLADYTITSAEETTLGANQWLSDSQRLSWNTDSSIAQKRGQRKAKLVTRKGGTISVTLSPMDIKTFVITMVPK